MAERVLSSHVISKRLVCATIYPSDDGAVVRFYIIRDLLLTRSGSCTVQREVTLGQFEINGDEFRPSKPRRLYDVTFEETSFGGGRDG